MYTPSEHSNKKKNKKKCDRRLKNEISHQKKKKCCIAQLGKKNGMNERGFTTSFKKKKKIKKIPYR